MSTRRVLAFSGIRSDYDLMSGLYAAIHSDSELQLGLIVSGAHLSETYGLTVGQVEADGIPIVARIESLLDSQSLASRLKSASILLQGCLSAVADFDPDVILFPGDREDVMVGALVGAYLGIPTIHFFGGDHASDGNVDNPVRHATSKLSSLHFVAHEQHRRRLLSLGEPSERIHVIGSPALDKFRQIPMISRDELLAEFERPFWKRFALVIHHPIMGYEAQAGVYFEQILLALQATGLPAFISYPNTDAGNKDIIRVIERYQNDDQFVFYKNLERPIFINLMRQAAVMIGNSSAGLLEAPMIPLAVVNVGERQRGRLAAENVLFVDQSEESITKGIQHALSPEFQMLLRGVVSPYGAGDSVPRALALLKQLDIEKFARKVEDPLQ